MSNFSLKSSIQTGQVLGCVDRISNFSRKNIPNNKSVEELFEICDAHYLKHGECEGCEYFVNNSCALKKN